MRRLHLAARKPSRLSISAFVGLTEDFGRAGKDEEHQRQGTQVAGRPKGGGCPPCVMNQPDRLASSGSVVSGELPSFDASGARRREDGRPKGRDLPQAGSVYDSRPVRART